MISARWPECFIAVCILIFKMNRKHHHSRLDLVEHIRIFQRGIQLVYVTEPVADLDFRRDGYKGQVEIKPHPELKTKIILLEFYQLFRIPGGGITREVCIEFDSAQQISSEVPDPV